MEKHKKLLLRSGSMVIKIYRHSVIKEHGLCFPEGYFTRIIVQARCGVLYLPILEKGGGASLLLLPAFGFHGAPYHRGKVLGSYEAAALFYDECKKEVCLIPMAGDRIIVLLSFITPLTCFLLLSGVRKPRPVLCKGAAGGVFGAFSGIRNLRKILITEA